MSFLKRLRATLGIGHQEIGPSEAASPTAAVDQQPAPRPFDLYDLANKADQAGSTTKARALFQQAIHAYRTGEPEGESFILGRFGDFLHRHGEIEAARQVYEEAVKLGTDIPAIYAGLMTIGAAAGDEEALFNLAETWMNAAPTNNSAFNFLIRMGSDLARQSEFAQAEQVLKRTEQFAISRSDSGARLRALVEMARTAELAGEPDRAAAIYEQSVAAGYRERPGVTRLLMLYEKSKRWADLLSLAESCLVGLKDVAWEADLQKRISRARARMQPAPSHSVRAVRPPTFAIRVGKERLSLIDEVPIKHGARNLAYSPDGTKLVVSAGTTKGPNVNLIDLNSSEPNWAFQALGSSADVDFLASGRIVATSGTGRIGDGTSEIVILDPDGTLIARTSLPDRTSEVRCSHDRIYAGCRNGFMYCLGGEGARLWEFLVPQKRVAPFEGDTFRACPYFVQVPADGDGVVFSSWHSLYRLGPNGTPRWHWTADPTHTRWQSNVPFAIPGHDEPYLTVLGLRSRPTDEDLRRAFRKRALETHPDRHPQNPNATDEFRAVLEAYEALMGGFLSGNYSQGIHVQADPFGIEISVAVAVTVFGLAVSDSGSRVLTSLSDGSLILLNEKGKPEYRLVSNEGAGQLVASPNLQFSVYSSWKGISFFSGSGLVSSFPAEVLHRLSISDDGRIVAAWRDKTLHLFDGTGGSLASVDFAQNIHDVKFGPNSELALSAGRVYRFRLGSDAFSPSSRGRQLKHYPVDGP